MVLGGLAPRRCTRFSPLGLNSCLILHWLCCLFLCQAFQYCFSRVFCLSGCVVLLVFVCVGGVFVRLCLLVLFFVFGWIVVRTAFGVCACAGLLIVLACVAWLGGV